MMNTKVQGTFADSNFRGQFANTMAAFFAGPTPEEKARQEAKRAREKAKEDAEEAERLEAEAEAAAEVEAERLEQERQDRADEAQARKEARGDDDQPEVTAQTLKNAFSAFFKPVKAVVEEAVHRGRTAASEQDIVDVVAKPVKAAPAEPAPAPVTPEPVVPAPAAPVPAKAADKPSDFATSATVEAEAKKAPAAPEATADKSDTGTVLPPESYPDAVRKMREAQGKK